MCRSGTRCDYSDCLWCRFGVHYGRIGWWNRYGIAPIVAEEVVLLEPWVAVTTPSVERRQRMLRALEGLEALRQEADAVLVLDNNRLLHYVPNYRR